MRHTPVREKPAFQHRIHADRTDTKVKLLLQILNKESLVSSGMVTKIKQEIRILKSLRHPNVVELKEVLASRQQIFMVMELVHGGELFDKIIAEGPMSVEFYIKQQQIPANRWNMQKRNVPGCDYYAALHHGRASGVKRIHACCD